MVSLGRIKLREQLSGGRADWIIRSLYGFRERDDPPYSCLTGSFREIPGIVTKLGFILDELPDSTTVCTRRQTPKGGSGEFCAGYLSSFWTEVRFQALNAICHGLKASEQYYANR